MYSFYTFFAVYDKIDVYIKIATARIPTNGKQE